jgi:putative ABC transport system permease protein
MGYVLGILLSHLGMAILASFMKNTYRYSFSGTQFLPEEGWLLLGALAVGFVAALIPALQARRTDISETLGNG